MQCKLPTPPSKEPRISLLNSLQLEYMEADHVMIIPIDLRCNTLKSKLVNKMTWDYPHHADTVDEGKRTQILGNIMDYLKIEGYSN